jgi:hypothetical protein
VHGCVVDYKRVISGAMCQCHGNDIWRGIEGRAKKQLFSGIIHILIISEFKKASDLGCYDV